MPAPRRRRPVQPATRVRLPRTARPRTGPATATPLAEAPATDAGEAVKTDLHPDDLHPDEAVTDEAVTDARPTAESAAGGLRADEVARDEATADGAAAGEPADGAAAEGADREAAADRDAAAAERGPAAARRHPLVLPISLGALAVILGGLAVWFGLEASSANSGVDTSNAALTDPAATRQVSQQIASAVDTIFSYNYADTATTSQAAAALLSGRARGEYDTLFRLVRQDAPQEKLVLTTTVTNIGVESLIGNQARLLIFANQRDTAGAVNKTSDAGAMFAVNAVRQGGRWKITGIETFGAGG